jgi:hypothetical protein
MVASTLKKVAILKDQSPMVLFIILDAHMVFDKACDYYKLHKSKELLKFAELQN